MLATDGKRLALHYTNYSNPVPTLQDVLYLCGPCHKNLHNEARVLPDRKRRRVADAVKGLLLALEVDMQDENFVETPRRVSSYFLEHFLEEKDSIELEEAEAAAYPSSYSGDALGVEYVCQRDMPAPPPTCPLYGLRGLHSSGHRYRAVEAYEDR